MNIDNIYIPDANKTAVASTPKLFIVSVFIYQKIVQKRINPPSASQIIFNIL